MNKKIVFIAATVAIVISAFIMKPKNDMVGHWVITSQKEKVMVDFNKDMTLKVNVPQENFTIGGMYKMNGDVISLEDSTCGKKYWGTYKVKFITPDSISTMKITDSCMARSSALDKGTLVRQK